MSIFYALLQENKKLSVKN